MTNTSKVSQRDAEAVLTAVKKRYEGLFDDGDGPTLNMDFDGRPAIVWESGPYEWAMRAAVGGVDDEVFTSLNGEFGLSVNASRLAATEAKLSIPHSVYVEPYYSFVLSIYPND